MKIELAPVNQIQVLQILIQAMIEKFQIAYFFKNVKILNELRSNSNFDNLHKKCRNEQCANYISVKY